MIPGMDKAMKNVEIGADAFVPIESIIGSMTPYERRNPSCLNGSRKQRIAAGSGRSIQEVNRFLKQFEDTRKVIISLNGVTGLIEKKIYKTSEDENDEDPEEEEEELLEEETEEEKDTLEAPQTQTTNTVSK